GPRVATRRRSRQCCRTPRRDRKSAADAGSARDGGGTSVLVEPAGGAPRPARGLPTPGRSGDRRLLSVLLAEIVATSAAVGGTAARSEKVDRLATTLRRLEPAEASVAVAYLSSQLRQRQIGVGYASMRDLPEPAAEPSLTLAAVDSALERVARVAGKDSQNERRRQIVDLFARATAPEQHFLVRLIIGELRH